MVQAIRNWLRLKLEDESGQMLPFLAVAMVIIIGWTAVQLGLSKVYLEKTRLRDAADAAALAVIESAEVNYVPTYYGERWVRPKRDKDGNIIREGYYKKTTSDRQPKVVLSSSVSRRQAQRFFERNLQAAGISHYKVLSFKVSLKKETQHKLQVVVRRPNTEGRSETYMELYPRWVRARVDAKVEVPVPAGAAVGTKTMQVFVRGETQRTLKNLKISSRTGEAN